MAQLLWQQAVFSVAAAVLWMAAPGARAQGVAASAPAQASVEAGRELFTAHCTRCHGGDATGTADGPNLLPRVKGMSESSFAGAVLKRYRWSVPVAEAGGESAAREAMMRGVLQRRQSGDTMPAWESEPAVAKGVKSLYDFLSSKAR